MTDARKLFATLIASLIVASVLAGALPAAAASGPEGMLALGDAQVSEDIPEGADMPIRASDLEGAIYASEHADTLEVVLTTPERADPYLGDNASVLADDEIAIVLRDDEVHEGRDVAVDLDVLEAGVGFVPEVAYGTHEDGERWESAIERDGTVGRFHIPEFSTNSVSFSAEVQLTGSPATDGTTYQYDLSSTDAVGDFRVNVTGERASEWDNQSASDVSATSTQPLSVGGNLAPVGPDPKGEPTLNVTSRGLNHSEMDGSVDSNTAFLGDSSSGNPFSAEVQFNQSIPQGETIEAVKVGLAGGAIESGEHIEVDIYIVEGEQPDQVVQEGTQVVDDAYIGASGMSEDRVFDFNSSYAIGENTENLTVEFVDDTNHDGEKDKVKLDMSVEPNRDDTYALSVLEDGSWSYYNRRANVSLFTQPAKGVSVSDGDGESVTFGDFSTSESVTKEINLSASSSELDFDATNDGPIDYELRVKERTSTPSGAVEVNGNSTSFSALEDGEKATLTTDTDSIVEGTNRVNVTLDSGSLSADAPTPAVELRYSHDTTDKQTIDYSAEVWSERYNISRTYGDATEDPTLTIPFESEVVDVGSVEVRRNGGTWKQPSAWTRDNTTLTIEFGSIDSGDTLEVRATGRKVITRNGDIQVLEPTVEGDTLDSKIEVLDRSEDFAIDVSGSDRIHYTAEESWEASSHVVVDASGGQELRLPDAQAGSQTRVRTAPLDVTPESGESEVVVENADEPRFSIREGNTTGAASVDVTYYETLSGERYVLWSETQDREIDADRAESPVLFTTDGEADTYTIQQVDRQDAGVSGVPPKTSDVGAPLVLVVPVVGISVAGLFWAGRRFGGARGIRGNAILLVGSTVVAITAVELVAPGTLASMFSTLVFALGDSVAGGIGAAIAAVVVLVGLWQLDQRTRASVPWWVMGPAITISAVAALEAIRPGSVLGALEVVLAEYGGLVVLAGIALVGYVIYQRRKTQRAEASTPDTEVTLDLGNSEE